MRFTLSGSRSSVRSEIVFILSDSTGRHSICQSRWPISSGGGLQSRKGLVQFQQDLPNRSKQSIALMSVHFTRREIPMLARVPRPGHGAPLFLKGK